MTPVPIWFGPREGFSQRCVTHFGFGFDAGYVANWTPPTIPEGVKVQRAYPTVTEAVELQGGRRKPRSNQASAMLSARKMQHGNLLGHR
jgi:hypothetical protein